MALTLCVSSASAATTTQNNTTSTYKAAGSTSTTSTYKAAGSTSTTTTVKSVKVTINQLDKSAKSVKKFIETNKRLPNYVTISNKKVSLPQYLTLLTYGVDNLKSGKKSSITVKTINNPKKPSQTLKSGTLTKKEFIKVVGNVKKYINTNKRVPNYAITSKGHMRYESLVYAYSKIMVFYGDKKRLPNTVSVAPWKVKATGTDMSQYLQVTANAQSNSATIKNLAASITKGKTTTYAKAQAIFNWVRNYLNYSFYYNTNKTALGALSDKTANCVDTSHLVIALSRAASIPARYQHGDCKFSDGWYGHVWSQLYVDGKWYNADAINDANTFGTINNWDLSTVKMKGTYASLPF